MKRLFPVHARVQGKGCNKLPPSKAKGQSRNGWAPKNGIIAKTTRNDGGDVEMETKMVLFEILKILVKQNQASKNRYRCARELSAKRKTKQNKPQRDGPFTKRSVRLIVRENPMKWQLCWRATLPPYEKIGKRNMLVKNGLGFPAKVK